jgi:hypothetical protein
MICFKEWRRRYRARPDQRAKANVRQRNYREQHAAEVWSEQLAAKMERWIRPGCHHEIDHRTMLRLCRELPWGSRPRRSEGWVFARRTLNASFGNAILTLSFRAEDITMSTDPEHTIVPNRYSEFFGLIYPTTLSRRLDDALGIRSWRSALLSDSWPVIPYLAEHAERLRRPALSLRGIPARMLSELTLLLSLFVIPECPNLERPCVVAPIRLVRPGGSWANFSSLDQWRTERKTRRSILS